MAKEDLFTPVNIEDDKRCPEATKNYLLSKGYKPYRKPNDEIVWINNSHRIYKSIKKPFKSTFLFINRFGQKKLKLWVVLSLYVIVIFLVCYLVSSGIIRVPFF